MILRRLAGKTGNQGGAQNDIGYLLPETGYPLLKLLPAGLPSHAF